MRWADTSFNLFGLFIIDFVEWNLRAGITNLDHTDPVLPVSDKCIWGDWDAISMGWYTIPYVDLISAGIHLTTQPLSNV